MLCRCNDRQRDYLQKNCKFRQTDYWNYFCTIYWNIFVCICYLWYCFFITDIPVYLAFIFGGIALATAPAPALSIVNEYHTSGPVTKTLIPLAAIDDIIGVVVFFTVISIVNGMNGNSYTSSLAIVGMVLLPFAIGIFAGICAAFLMKRSKNNIQRLILF